MKRLKNPRYSGHVLEVLQGILHFHIQHIGDALVLVLHLQRFIIVSCAAAHFALHPDIRQKVHFDFFQAVALTGFTPSAFDVEAKSARFVASHLGFRELSVEVSD